MKNTPRKSHKSKKARSCKFERLGFSITLIAILLFVVVAAFKSMPKHIKTIPEDGVTGSNKVVTTYDGSGGWFYDSNTGNLQVNFPTPSIPRGSKGEPLTFE
jgi:hypothetical protein